MIMLWAVICVGVVLYLFYLEVEDKVRRESLEAQLKGVIEEEELLDMEAELRIRREDLRREAEAIKL